MTRFISTLFLLVFSFTASAQTCVPPTNLTATSITQNSAVLSWNTLPNANRYTFQWKSVSVTNWTTVTTYTANTYNLNGLQPGTAYSFKVSISCNGGSTSTYSSPYTFTTASAVTCVIPANLGATNITQSSARLTWNAVQGAQGYTVQWQTSGSGSWNTVAGTRTSPYDFAGLNPGTVYSFRVSAVCNNGSSTNYSNSFTFTTTTATACVAPIGLAAKDVTQTSALLSWTAATGAQRYTLQWQPAGSTTWNTVANLTGTSYSLGGLTSGAGYTFRVSTICNDGTSSGNSLPQNFTAAACTVPAGLTATTFQTSARLGWTAVPGAQGYNLEWQLTGAAGWNVVAVVTGTSYNLDNLMPAKTYSFRLSAICTGGLVSNYSNAFSFTTSSCAVPSSLTATSTTQSSAILSWNAAQAAQRYTLQWKRANDSSWTTVESMATTSFDLTGLMTGTVYSFRVSTLCTDGSTSSYSSAYNFTTSGCATPSGLTAINITQNAARLSWNAVPTASYYTLQWKLATATGWTTVSNLSATSYDLSGLRPDTTYSFQLTVKCSDGRNSSVSSPFNFRTAKIATCAVPGNPTATNITRTSALVSWNTTFGAQRYTLQWKPAGTTPWITIAGITSTSYSLGDLTPGTSYSFQVAASCSDGSITNYNGPFEFTTTTTTATCAVPGNLSASNITGTFALLSWNAEPGAQRYTLSWQPAGETNWTSVSGLTSNSYSLSGLTGGTSYYFRVSAVCADGSSTNSSIPSSFTTAGCVTPSGLKATNITNISATLSWGSLAGIRSYNLEWKSSGDLNWTSVNTSTATYNVSGLRPGTVYNFMVSANCNDGSTTVNSTIAAFTTATSACSAPVNLSVSNITGTGARLAWSAVTGAMSYTIQMQLFGTTNWVMVDTPRIASYSLSGLISGTAYSFRVSALCSNGTRTDYSSPYTFSTSSNLSVTNITENSAKLSWNTVTNAQHYTVQWQHSNAPSWTTVSNITTTSSDLTGLTPATSYAFKVSATFIDGSSSGYSNPYSFSTTTNTSDTQKICGDQPTPAGWVAIAYGGICSQVGSFIYFTKTIRKISGLPAGSTVQICGPEPTPAGWVTTAIGAECAVIGSTHYFRKTIKKIEGLAPGSEVQVCGDGESIPPDWIIIDRGGACAQVGNATYFTKTIKKATGNIMQICGNQATPAGWVVTGYGGVCATINNVVYSYKNIQKIEGMDAGSTVQICGPQPVPAGWITTGFTQQCTTIGNVIYFSRTIKKIEGMAAGSILQVCGPDPIPTGWVATALGGQCFVIGTTHYFTKTIKKIDGMPTGSEVQVCGNLPSPAGWVTVAYGGVCATIGNTVYYSKTIRKIDGMLAGSTVQICGTDKAPAGWVTTSIGGVCGTVANIIYYRRTIIKLEGMPLGSEVKVCGNFEPIPAGWVVIQPNGGVCGMMGSATYFSRTIRNGSSLTAVKRLSENTIVETAVGGKTPAAGIGDENGTSLNVKISPNPSNGDFKVQIGSNNQAEKVNIRVYDVYGRLIEVKTNVNTGNTISIGHNYVPGQYLLEVNQLNRKKQIRLIKL